VVFSSFSLAAAELHHRLLSSGLHIRLLFDSNNLAVVDDAPMKGCMPSSSFSQELLVVQQEHAILR